MEAFFDQHSGEVMILLCLVIVVGTLIVLVPQLLRAHMRKAEILHLEHMKAIENGQTIPTDDDRARVAGRMAMLVPMVVLIAVGVVTCFTAAYRPNDTFTVILAAWVVSGVVSLAAITGGVALIGRLAQLHAGKMDDDEIPDNPLTK